jgi:hypothetical protein
MVGASLWVVDFPGLKPCRCLAWLSRSSYSSSRLFSGVLRAKTPRLFLSHPRLYQPDEKTADDDDEDENDSEMTLNTYEPLG